MSWKKKYFEVGFEGVQRGKEKSLHAEGPKTTTTTTTNQPTNQLTKKAQAPTVECLQSGDYGRVCNVEDNHEIRQTVLKAI